MSQPTILMIANSELDSDLYYATKFLAPDPFIFIQTNGRKAVVMSDLELDRTKAQARVDTVLSYSQYEKRLKSDGMASPSVVDVVEAVLKEQGARELLVPETFGLRYADGLRSKGFLIAAKSDPFFEERIVKTEEEVRAITQTQRAIEAAVEAAIEVLREATVKKGLLYWQEGVLTSEAIKKIINLKLMELDCIAQHTIIAGGIQGCDPHDEGSGPLRPNETIVMDVFPRSSTSRYYADMTRTVVKGRASDAVKRLYETVRAAQEGAIEKIKDGAEGGAIHQWIMDLFEKKGYHTGIKDSRMQGFFHGTGHGVGLDIHEPPRISRTNWKLKAGEVVTVEPGLYYPEIGAVRIEDMVLVTQAGGINLTEFPKQLEV
jgi:Xaa-Pro aminopeptidase